MMGRSAVRVRFIMRLLLQPVQNQVGIQVGQPVLVGVAQRPRVKKSRARNAPCPACPPDGRMDWRARYFDNCTVSSRGSGSELVILKSSTSISLKPLAATMKE